MKRIIFLCLILLSTNLVITQITFVDSTKHIPTTDGGDAGASPITIVPPTMQTGDLVVVFTWARSSGSILNIVEAGGQTWTSEIKGSYTSTSTRIFWCQYNGTWSASPQFGATTATGFSGWMSVWRGTGGCTWTSDQEIVEVDDNTSPWASTSGSTVGDTTLTMVSWTSPDDNTWSTSPGTGWTNFCSQLRNLNGSDNSWTAAYRFDYASVTSLGVASKTQTLNGDDVTNILRKTWRLDTPGASTVKKRVIQ